METKPRLNIKVRLGPGTKNQTCLWFGQELGHRPRISGREVDHWITRYFARGVAERPTGDVVHCVITAERQYTAKFLRPLDFVFHIKPEHRLGELIHIRVRG